MFFNKILFSFLICVLPFSTALFGQIEYKDHEIGVSLSRLTLLGDQGIDYIGVLYRKSSDNLTGYRASIRIISPTEKDVENYFRLQLGKDWPLYRINDFVFYTGVDAIYGRYRIVNRSQEINVSEVGLRGIFGVKLYLWKYVSISTEPSLEFLVTKEKSEQGNPGSFERSSFEPDVYNLGNIRLSIQF